MKTKKQQPTAAAMKTILVGVEIKAVNAERSTLRAIFSTEDMDRHGDIVVQNWDLGPFEKNPVIINSHNYGDATEVIGKSVKTFVNEQGQLEGEIEFAVDANPKAKIIFDLYAGGFLNAFSVGFIPKQFDNEGKIIFSELLEVSAVSVPANSMALAKEKGIDVDALGAVKEADADEQDADAPADEDEDEDEEEEEAPEQDADTEIEKNLDLAQERIRAKAGAVLSKKSRSLLLQAKQSIEDLLAHADKAEEKAITPSPVATRTKTTVLKNIAAQLGKSGKVETRAKRDPANKVRAMNRIIRKLVKAKKL